MSFKYYERKLVYKLSSSNFFVHTLSTCCNKCEECTTRIICNIIRTHLVLQNNENILCTKALSHFFLQWNVSFMKDGGESHCSLLWLYWFLDRLAQVRCSKIMITTSTSNKR